MKITKLQIENFMRVNAMTIEPGDDPIINIAVKNIRQ